MNRRIHRVLAVLTLALTLTAAPAAHARPAESGRTVVFNDLSDAVGLLWDLLARTWGESGSSLDPNGAAATGDEGSGLDPDGSTSSGDEGSSLDPNGGR